MQVWRAAAAGTDTKSRPLQYFSVNPPSNPSAVLLLKMAFVDLQDRCLCEHNRDVQLLFIASSSSFHDPVTSSQRGLIVLPPCFRNMCVRWTNSGTWWIIFSSENVVEVKGAGHQLDPFRRAEKQPGSKITIRRSD